MVSSRKVTTSPKKTPVKKATPVSEEAVVEPPAPVVAEKKTTKKASSSKTTESTATAPVAPDPATEPVVEDKSTTEDTKGDADTSVEKEKTESLESAFLSKLSTFVNKVSAINKEVKELQALGKTLEKDFNAVVKVLSKHKSKTKTNENRTLSGFAMPSLLSDELYDFLKIEKGTLIPRKDVTKLINEYIKDNNLRNEEDKRKILPDSSLKKIFNCGDEDTVTYFNLQTYMKHHFIKDPNAVKPMVAAAA